jgi:citrate lyase subunit beta/citryl-CoA lyase
VHPRQLATINRTFTPSADEVARARAALRAFAEQQAAGQGAFVDESGRLVDAATIRISQDIVATADRLAARATRTTDGQPPAAG